MKNKYLKIAVSFIKSLLQGFTQIIWTMVAIYIFRNQAEEILMSNPEMFEKMLAVIFNGWIGLLVALTIFYMFVNLKDIGFIKNKPSIVKETPLTQHTELKEHST